MLQDFFFKTSRRSLSSHIFILYSCLFDEIAKIRQLSFFRSLLTDGLSFHFQENPVLQNLFDFQIDSLEYNQSSKKLTGSERRIQNSIKSKSKLADRKGGRRDQFDGYIHQENL